MDGRDEGDTRTPLELRSGATRAGVEQTVLAGHEVAITGRLASMDRSEAARHLARAGARYVERPGPNTQLLVVGAFGWPLSSDGLPTQALLEARRLQKDGSALVIASEEDFLVALGMEELQSGLHRLYTTEQLARMLDLPVGRIRSWIRQGLLEPARIARRLAWFDFRQVANVRVLRDLSQRGIGPARIRKSLEDLRHALGREQVGYGWLDALERRGPLLFRRDDGQLTEANGQLHLDFSAANQRAELERPFVLPQKPQQDADTWFEAGVQAEDDGRLSDAVKAYLNALLAGGPQAETCFNLANVLFALGRDAEAMQRYLQTIEIDPDYVEAWNNLGNVFSSMRRYEDAAAAYGQALAIEPRYADAHCNLAETLEQLGQLEDAREHWHQYLELDPDSVWAERVREKIETRRDDD